MVFRRDVLKKMVETGKMEARCNLHLTDDYRADDANNFGKSGWLPARLKKDIDDFKEGHMNFTGFDFSSRSGAARKEPNDQFHLRVHSNLNYTLRKKR